MERRVESGLLTALFWFFWLVTSINTRLMATIRILKVQYIYPFFLKRSGKMIVQ